MSLEQKQKLRFRSAEALSRFREHHADVTARSQSRMGAAQDDGTLYAGLSPDSGQPLYVMPRDYGFMQSFNDTAMRTASINESNAFGHDDWRLPTKRELETLYAMREAGNFNGSFDQLGEDHTGWYWSSTVDEATTNTWAKRFSDGATSNFWPSSMAKIRFVRG